MADVVIKIEGDASGAQAAVAQTIQSFQGLPGVLQGGVVTGFGNLQAASAGAGEAMQSSGQAAAEAAKGFEINQSEASSLARTLMMLGVIPPQLTRSFSYLLTNALNPTTLGFTAAILAVQGIALAFQAASAATEKERQEMSHLAEVYAEASKNLEKLLRLRGEYTEQGLATAVIEQLKFGGAGESGAAMPPEEALQLQEELDKRKVTSEAARLQAAQAYTIRESPDVPARAQKSPGDYLSWFLAQPEEEKTRLAADSSKKIDEVFALQALKRAAEARAEGAAREALAQRFALLQGAPIEDTRLQVRLLTRTATRWEMDTNLFSDPEGAWQKGYKSLRKIQESGRSSLEVDTGPRQGAGILERARDAGKVEIHYVGLHVHHHERDDAPSPATSGRTRGPQE